MGTVEAWSFTTNDGSLSATLDIKYADCGSLSTKPNLSDRIVGDGQCSQSTNQFLMNRTSNNVKNVPYSETYTLGTAWWYADDDYWYPMSVSEFSNVFGDGVDAIVWRVCTSCKKSHQSIYYKRLTPMKDASQMLNILKNSFVEETNTMA